MANPSELTPLLSPAGTDSHVIDIPSGESKTLSNGRLVKLLEDDLLNNNAKEKIQKIVDYISRFSPWYSGKKAWDCDDATCCVWQKWPLIVANWVAVGYSLGYITNKVWDSLPNGGGVGFVFLNIGVDIATPLLLPWGEAALASFVVDKTLTAKRDRAVLKIQSFIKHLELFGTYSFDPVLSSQTLVEAELLSATKKAIVRSLDAGQLLKLKKELSALQFGNFTNGSLTDTQIYYIKFFQQLPEMTESELVSSIRYIKRYVQGDATLYNEVVEAVHQYHGRNENVDNTLLEIGKELKLIHSDTSVDVLGKFQKIFIKTKRGVLASTLEVRWSLLLQFEPLKKKMKGDAVEIYLQDDEENELEAYKAFFGFIDGKKITLSNRLVVPLIAISDFYQVEKCVIVCFEYLINNQHEFDQYLFYELLLRHAHFPYGMKKSPEMLRDRIKALLLEGNYPFANRLMQVAHRFRVNIADELDEFIKSEISKEVDNIELLKVCRGLDILYPIVEKRYSEVMNISIFRDVLEYSLAPASKSEVLRSACVRLFEECRGNREAMMEIYNQWPPGGIPGILVALLEGGTNI